MKSSTHGIAPLQALRAMNQPMPLRANGLDWQIIDTGGNAMPLVMLPGALGTCELFYRQIVALHGRGRIVSANYPAISNPMAIVESLASLLDQRRIERINLFGTSLGGYLAQCFAARHAERVNKLVIGNSFIDSRRIVATEAFDPSVAGTLDAAALQTLWRTRVQETARRLGESELTAVQLEALSEPGYAAQLKARMLTLPACNRTPDAVAAPVAIIDCEDDVIIDAQTRLETRARYPGARVYSLRTGGHYPYITAPEKFNAILADECFGD